MSLLIIDEALDDLRFRWQGMFSEAIQSPFRPTIIFRSLIASTNGLPAMSGDYRRVSALVSQMKGGASPWTYWAITGLHPLGLGCSPQNELITWKILARTHKHRHKRTDTRTAHRSTEWISVNTHTHNADAQRDLEIEKEGERERQILKRERVERETETRAWKRGDRESKKE